LIFRLPYYYIIDFHCFVKDAWAMVIDVRLVPEGHSRIERDSALEAFADDLPPFSGPVRCGAEVDRMGPVIAVALRFDGAFVMECARCLESVCVPVGGDLRIILKEEQGRHGPAQDDGCGADFFFDVNHDLVDVSPAIYDEIMTALPLKPLCSERCEGIKVADGGGLGGGEKPVDPRWEGLMKLKAGTGF